MKKYLTLSNVCKCVAVLFGLVAFFVMFADQVYVEFFGEKGYVGFEDALFAENGAAISFVGYLFALLASLGVCATIFIKLDAKVKKIVSLALAGLLLIAGIFIFIEAAVINGNTDSTAFKLAAGPIVGGLFSFIAAISVAASEFVPDKALVK